MIIKRQRINEEIQASELFLINEEGKPLGKVSYDQAMLLVSDAGLDLVEVAANTTPPVAKIINFSKKLYEEAKLKRKQRVRQKTPELKEIKLGMKIGEHDLSTKVKKSKEFLQKNHKVRVKVQLKGREMLFKDRASELIDKFRILCDAEFEQHLKRQGNNFSAIIKKKK